MTFPNWFEQTAKENFETYLAHLADEPDLTFLQIGAFTGDASVWMLDNILTHPFSILEDVDTWEGSQEAAHDAMDFNEVYKTYKEKVFKDGNVDKVFPFKTTSNNYFNEKIEPIFDFIYIDGDHTASVVLDDAVHAWQALKPGGIMAFDDYTWVHPNGELFTPRPAINFFVWAKQRELKIIAANSQLWIVKNDNTEVA